MNIKSVLTTCFVICASMCRHKTPLYKQSSAPVESRVKDLLGRMTVDEKIGPVMLSARMGNVYQNIQGCSAFRTI